jgi:protoheme IX farnesyltransferase
MKKYLKLYLELAKVRITFAVTLTTFVGYFMVDGNIDAVLWWVLLGIFLLASGSAALNQYQEHHLDAQMDRTKNRPIPSGAISPTHGLIVAFLLSATGSYLLYWSAGFESMQLGILALIWYNAIYTPLKRKSAFAVVPGSVIGAIPPMVGYVAAGGNVLDPQILAFAFFMFMWQIPHFWLLIMKNGTDYRKAGFPTIADVYSEKQLKSITYVWIAATAVSSMLLPLMHVLEGTTLLVLLSISLVLVLVGFASIFRNDYTKKSIFKYFMGINVYLLVILGLIIAGV